MEKYYFNLYLLNGIAEISAYGEPRDIAGNPYKTFADLEHDLIKQYDKECIGYVYVTWDELALILGRKHSQHGKIL